MKTTPLPEILKQITPLPYRSLISADGIVIANDSAFASGAASVTIVPRVRAEHEANSAYLTHAANVLPGLVEALGRAGDIARGDLLDGLHGESVSKDDFDAQLRNVRGIAMSLEAILSNALTHATSVPVNS